jgi:hypothetical protein
MEKFSEIFDNRGTFKLEESEEILSLLSKDYTSEIKIGDVRYDSDKHVLKILNIDNNKVKVQYKGYDNTYWKDINSIRGLVK